MTQSQSACDVTEDGREGLDSEDDMLCSQGMLGSRALSHDSIFLAEQCQSSPEPPRVLSQESIHGRIRALQVKLQQQNMRLGLPPLVLPVKQPEDLGGSSEDDGLPHSPPEMSAPRGASYKFPVPPRHHSSLSLVATGSEEEEQSSPQPLSQPLSPVTRPSARPPSPAPPSMSLFPPSGPGVDFSVPIQLNPRLDNSAALHRMSVKPRNQRASAKVRGQPSSAASRLRSEKRRPEKEEEEWHAISKEIKCFRSYSSQVLRPGEALTTPIRSPPTAWPQQSQGGEGDAQQPPPELQAPLEPEPLKPEGGTTTTIPTPLLQWPTLKLQTPAWASVFSPGTAVASVTPPAAEAKPLNEKAAEAVAARPPGSNAPAGGKGCGEVGEITKNSMWRSAQNNTSSSTNPPGGSVPTAKTGLKQTTGGAEAPVTQSKRDNLSKSGVQGAPSQTESRPKDQPPDNLASVMPPWASANLASLVALRSSSLRRNTAPAEKTAERGSLPHAATAPSPESEDQAQTEAVTLKQQKLASGAFCYSVPTTRDQDWPRMGSFLSVVVLAGAKKEGGSAAKPPLNLSQRAQERGEGVKPKEQPAPLPSGGEREQRAASGPSVGSAPAKPRDLHSNHPAAREKGDSQGSETQGVGVEVAEEEEVPEGVEEADEAQEEPRGNKGEEEERKEDKEERGAFGVKLRSTSLSLHFRLDTTQSELKRHSAEVSDLTPPLAPLAALSHPAVSDGQLDPPRGPPRGYRAGSVLKKAPSQGSETPTSTPAPPQGSSSPLKSDSRQRAGSLRQADKAPAQPASSANKGAQPVLSFTKEGTFVPSPPNEGTPAPLPAKEGTPAPSAPRKEAAAEVSWMNLAREKTRSLGQLFTSRLPEFTALQTARPTPTTAAQPSAAQAPVRPAQLTAAQPPAAQPPAAQPTMRSAQLTASQPPATQPNTRGILTAKQPFTQSPQQSAQQTTTQPILRPSPLNATQPPASSNQPMLRSAQPTVQQHLLSSPKLIHQQAPQGTPQSSPRSTPQPKLQSGGDESSTAPGKADRTPMSQGKGSGTAPLEARPPWATGVGSKATFLEKWADRTPPGTKVSLRPVSMAEQQKATPETCPQSAAPLRGTPTSRETKEEGKAGTKTPESAPTSIPMQLIDREDKWQRKTRSTSSSPSTSSPLQSISDGGQPSWMELAKRKSMAWSDKTMD